MHESANRVGTIHWWTIVVWAQSGSVSQRCSQSYISRPVAARHALHGRGGIIRARITVGSIDRVRIEHVAEQRRMQTRARRVHARRVGVVVINAVDIGVTVALVKRVALSEVGVSLPHAGVASRTGVVLSVPRSINDQPITPQPHGPNWTVVLPVGTVGVHKCLVYCGGHIRAIPRTNRIGRHAVCVDPNVSWIVVQVFELGSDATVAWCSVYRVPCRDYLVGHCCCWCSLKSKLEKSFQSYKDLN